MRKWWLVLAGVLISGVVIAVNVGTYQGCDDCTLGSLSGAEESIFIRTIVNQDVSSWVDGNNDPKSVNLCNSSRCATYRYIPLSGMFQRIGSPWSNPANGGCNPNYVNCLPR
jgi:hypothetical protein